MGDNRSIFRTVDDLKNDISSAVGNSVTVLRIRRDIIMKRLAAYQERIVDLRYQETLIKARLYNNSDMTAIKNLSAGPAQTVSPNQAMAPFETNLKGDHQSLNYSIAQIERQTFGLKDLKSEAARISTEILELAQKINSSNNELKDINDKLAKADAADTGTGGLSASMESNRVLRSSYSSLYFLYQQAQVYHDLSVPDSKGARQFPDNDRKRTERLTGILQTFGSTVKTSFPKYISNLNLNDPGDSKNIEFLGLEMSIMQNALGDKDVSAIEQKALKSMSVINTTVQDTFNSVGVARKDLPKAVGANNLQGQTANYVTASMDFLGNPFSIGPLPSIGDAVSKAWQSKVGETLNLPACDPPAQNTAMSAADRGKIAVRASIVDAQAQGASIYTKKVATARQTITGQKPVTDTTSKYSAGDWWTYFDDNGGLPTITPRAIQCPQSVVFPKDTSTQQNWLISAAVALTPADASATASAGYEAFPEVQVHKEAAYNLVTAADPSDPNSRSVLATDSSGHPITLYPVYLLKFITPL